MESTSRVKHFPQAQAMVSRTGAPVFPLVHRSKLPACKWTKVATTTPPATLGHYGIRTGGGLIVLDIDRKKGRDGFAALNEVELWNELTFPPTLTIRTPTGGEHRYYNAGWKVKLRNAVNLFHENSGIDLRAENGYVVGPGSTVTLEGKHQIDGTYTVVLDLPVADLPANIVDLLERHARQSTAANSPEALWDRYGALHEALLHFPVSGALADNYGAWINLGHAIKGALGPEHEPHEGLDLWAAWSERCIEAGFSGAATYAQCADKWHKDRLQPHTLGADYIYNNARKNGWRGMVDAALSPQSPLSLVAPESIITQADLRAERATEAVLKAASPYGRTQITDQSEPEERPNWLVYKTLPDYHPEGRVGLLLGVSRAGKSTVADDLAHSLVTARDFCGRPVDHSCGVLVFASEDLQGHNDRPIALKRHYNSNIRQPWTTYPAPSLDVEGGAKAHNAAWFQWAHQIIIQEKERFGCEYGLIIVDTLSATLHIEDENSNAEAASAIRQFRELSKATGAVVLVTHHAGKSQEKGARGASALTGNTDFVITVDAKVDERRGEITARYLSITKMRGGMTGGIGSFNLIEIDLGIRDNQGRSATAAIPVFVKPSETAAAVELPESAQALLQVIEELHAGPTAIVAEKVYEQFGRSLHRDARKQGITPTEDAIRASFGRSIGALSRANLVTLYGHDGKILEPPNVGFRAARKTVGGICLVCAPGDDFD